MGLAFMILTFGGMLVYSSLKDQGILQVFAGEKSDPIVKKDYSSYTEAINDGAVSGPPAPGAVTNNDPNPISQGLGSLGSLVTGSTVNMDGKPVPAWIAEILAWAKSHGWEGTVTSGYRSYAEQQTAATNYGLEHYGSSGPQGSNHRKKTYPGGAVDVTAPEQLNSVLRNYPKKPTLVWGGPVIGDTVHFSSNGH